MENKATPWPMTIERRDNNIPSTLHLFDYQTFPNAAPYSICPKKLASCNSRWVSLLVFVALWVVIESKDKEELVKCRGKKNFCRLVSGRAPRAARHPKPNAGWRGGERNFYIID